jgi:hypothetical protein
MELVILDVGLDIGVISPALFSMMVVMALVTTFMTSPVLNLIIPAEMTAGAQAKDAATEALTVKDGEGVVV